MFATVSAADPRPARLPLPGGRSDARVKLHLFRTGEMSAPPGYLERPSGPLAPLRTFGLHPRRSAWEWLPVPAFLVEHPGAGLVLIDTGLHESVADSATANFGPSGRLYTFRFSGEQALTRRLRERGVAPHDIDTVVMTHLHIDHASAVSDFPAATFLVDRREWEAATRPRGSLRGYVRRQFDHPFDWRAVDFDGPEARGFAPFGRTLDLFGDGSVRLLSTPGHTAGHMSVLLRLRHREALLTVDAAYTRRTIDEEKLPLITQDEHNFKRSLGEIRRYVEQTPGALVVPGHDAATWDRLDPSYV